MFWGDNMPLAHPPVEAAEAVSGTRLGQIVMLQHLSVGLNGPLPLKYLENPALSVGEDHTLC
jgi:hypothetical protein